MLQKVRTWPGARCWHTLDTEALQASRQQLQAEKAQALAQLAETRAGPRQETIAVTRARVHELQEELALAQRQRTRRQQLSAKGVITREELDQAQTSLGNSWQARLGRGSTQSR